MGKALSGELSCPCDSSCFEANRKADLTIKSTHIGSNYPCLEQIFMVPKVFEPLKFYCTFESAVEPIELSID